MKSIVGKTISRVLSDGLLLVFTDGTGYEADGYDRGCATVELFDVAGCTRRVQLQEMDDRAYDLLDKRRKDHMAASALPPEKIEQVEAGWLRPKGSMLVSQADHEWLSKWNSERQKLL